MLVLQPQHHVSRVLTSRPEWSHCSADMIGVAMRQNDEINIRSRSSSRSQRIGQVGTRSSEIRTGTRVDEHKPTVGTNDEDIARARKLPALIGRPSELALDLRQIHVRRNVKTQRHRKGARVTEVPSHGAVAFCEGSPPSRECRSTGDTRAAQGSFRNTGPTHASVA